jgi:hypothetical protein
MCVLIFSTTFDWNISHSKKNSASYYHNARRSANKVPVIFIRFSWNLNVLHRFSKNPQKSNSMNIRPLGADLFLANRHDVAVRNFANTPQNRFAWTRTYINHNDKLARRLGRKIRTLQLSSREGIWRICLSHCWSKKFCGTRLSLELNLSSVAT